MTNLAKGVAYFLNTRPLCFLSTVLSARDFIIGLALLLALPDLTQTLLWANLNDLGGAWIYGIILMVIAVCTGFAAVGDKNRWTQRGLQVGAWFWLFASVSYLIHGSYVLAVIWMLMASIPSGYLSFYYKHLPIWEKPKQEWREKLGLNK